MSTHERAKTIFLNAAEIDSEEQRRAYIEAQCAGDEDLRKEVAQLLEHRAPTPGFLENPAVTAATTVEL